MEYIYMAVKIRAPSCVRHVASRINKSFETSIMDKPIYLMYKLYAPCDVLPDSRTASKSRTISGPRTVSNSSTAVT